LQLVQIMAIWRHFLKVVIHMWVPERVMFDWHTVSCLLHQDCVPYIWIKWVIRRKKRKIGACSVTWYVVRLLFRWAAAVSILRSELGVCLCQHYNTTTPQWLNYEGQWSWDTPLQFAHTTAVCAHHCSLHTPLQFSHNTAVCTHHCSLHTPLKFAHTTAVWTHHCSLHTNFFKNVVVPLTRMPVGAWQ